MSLFCCYSFQISAQIFTPCMLAALELSLLLSAGTTSYGWLVLSLHKRVTILMTVIVMQYVVTVCSAV